MVTWTHSKRERLCLREQDQAGASASEALALDLSKVATFVVSLSSLCRRIFSLQRIVHNLKGQTSSHYSSNHLAFTATKYIWGQGISESCSCKTNTSKLNDPLFGLLYSLRSIHTCSFIRAIKRHFLSKQDFAYCTFTGGRW